MSMPTDVLKKYTNKIFIETGSKMGGTAIRAVTRCGFEEAYTIELDKGQYRLVQKYCAKYNNIHTYLGDSASILPSVLSEVEGNLKACTIWLDAHPIVPILSVSNTPILEELLAIKNAKLTSGFKILVDDLRLFSETDRKKILEIAESIGQISYESNVDPSITSPDILVIA